MPNLSIYVPSVEERDALKDTLSEIAVSFGFVTANRKAESQGHVLSLLRAIVAGDIAVVMLDSDEQHYAALNALRDAVQDEAFPTDHWSWSIAEPALATIADALEAAQRRTTDE